MEAGPRREGAGGDSSLNYAAIGATQTEEVLAYPPKGYRAHQGRQRIGSGVDRFESAARTLMTWGVLRNSGIEVTDITAESDDVAYTGVEFDKSGRPIGPSEPKSEELFAADGTPFVSAGMTAVLVLSAGPVHLKAPVKVIYVIEEPKRVGFAYGSRVGNPVELEQLLLVEHYDDGGVWLTIRSVSRPTTRKWRVLLGLLQLGQKAYDKRFLTSLHPTRSPGSA